MMPEGSLGSFWEVPDLRKDPGVVLGGPWSGFGMLLGSQKWSRIEENLIKKQVVFFPQKKTVFERSGVGQSMIFDAAQYR